MDDLIEFDALTEDELPVQPQLDEQINDRIRRSIPLSNQNNNKNTSDMINMKQCKPNYMGRHNRCCNDGFERSEEAKKIKRECFADVKKQRKFRKNEMDGDSFDVFSCEKVEKAKSSVICAMECVSKKQGLVRKNL